MTPLVKPVRRVSKGALDGAFGCDRGRKLVATLAVGDLLELRPLGTRRVEQVSLFDVYRFAIRCRVNLDNLNRARDAKARKAARLAERRLTRPLK